MNHFEYLLFNTVIFGLASLSALAAHVATQKVQFPRIIPTCIAFLLVSLPYIIWDAFVTNWWWEFSEIYILGTYLGPLPIEEVLFFGVVPWSCLVIWVNLHKNISGAFDAKVDQFLAAFGAILLCYSLFESWWYSAAIAMGVVCFALGSAYNYQWLRQKASVLFLTITFGLTCVFNGYLTARPIVIYNETVKSNLNLGSIPAEDIVYGLILVGATAQVYDYAAKKLKARPESTN